MVLKTLNKSQLEIVKNELKKVAVNVTENREIGHLADGTKMEENFTVFTTPLNKICICEYENVREQGILCLVI